MRKVFKPLADSQREKMVNGSIVGEVDPFQRIEISIKVRSRISDSEWEAKLMKSNLKLPSERSYLSRESLATHRGADLADLAKVEAFAQANHLTVVESSVQKCIIRVAGTLCDLSKAFNVQLHNYRANAITYRGREGWIHVPAELEGIVLGVFGFDNRPAAKPHVRVSSDETMKGRDARIDEGLKRRDKKKANSRSLFAAGDVRTVVKLTRMYKFPSKLDGAGQCIALIELNGTDPKGDIVPGTGYRVSDLKAFFKKAGRVMPDISAVGVGRGGNAPGSGQEGDFEVTLDIDVVGAVAPKAKIVVYFAPNTDAGFLEAVSAAVYDNVRRPSVISISWGMQEDGATQQFLNGLHHVLQDAAALGVTVCCETGDFGSSDQPAASRDGKLHVEFPASSPFALACGGTKLVTSQTAVCDEVVWNDGDKGGAGGGGISNKFMRPPYQATTTIPLSPEGKNGRGLPDVAGNVPGYRVIVEGKERLFYGTSAVAPLWAGLVTLFNQRLSEQGGNTVGFLNPLLYTASGFCSAFTDIDQGSNDIDGTLSQYVARRGWDPCTGMGSPNGTLLLQQLQGGRQKVANQRAVGSAKTKILQRS